MTLLAGPPPPVVRRCKAEPECCSAFTGKEADLAAVSAHDLARQVKSKAAPVDARAPA